MGWHPLARPEWKNSWGGDGVIAVSSMSLVKSSLMCIPEPASNAQTQSSSLPLVSSNQSLQQDPSSSFPSGDLSGLCQGCSAATTDVQCLLWTSSQRIKASGPPMGVGWADGQPSPQDARPLQCLLLKYPQLQRKKKTNKPGKTQRKSHVVVLTSSLTLAEPDLAEAELQRGSPKHRAKMPVQGTTFAGSLCQVPPGFTPTLPFRLEIFHPGVFFFPDSSAKSRSQRDEKLGQPNSPRFAGGMLPFTGR